MAGTHEQAPRRSDCLGQTCMKWEANGELSSVDLQHVLSRLTQFDQSAAQISTCDLTCDRGSCEMNNQTGATWLE